MFLKQVDKSRSQKSIFIYKMINDNLFAWIIKLSTIICKAGQVNDYFYLVKLS